jgi:hypothetical protein
MAEIEISFAGETRYLNDLLFDILEANSVHEGMKKEIPGGASLTLGPMEMKKAAAYPAIITLALNVGVGVGSSLVAAYIYGKLQKHKRKEIRTIINRRETHITQSGLVKIIEERIEHEEKKYD